MADSSDDLVEAIGDAVAEPASFSIEGEAFTSRGLPDILAGAKAIAATNALKRIGAGGYPFVGVRLAPPGASGVERCE